MRKKKVLILFSVIIAIAALGFSLGNWNDKTTVTGYINNGGPTNTSVIGPNFTGETDATPVWAPAANMPAPTRYHGAGVGYSRNDTNWLYCLGGDADGSGGNSGVLSIYNATTNTWSTGATMPSTLVFYTTAARLGSTIYVVGGIGPGGAFTSMVNEVKRYNILTNTWLSNAANYPVTVADGKAAGYQDSLIYVVGGITGGGTVATNLVHVYNANSNTWRTATALPVTRCSGAMAISGDTIVYVAGGTGYNTGLTNTVYRGVISQSDRSVITWTTGTNFPGTTSHRFDAAPWGCQGIIVSPGSASGFGTSNTVFRYSPGGNNWTPMPNYAQTTSATFMGTASRTGNIWRLMIASGLVLSPPYSIPQANVLTDTLCPVTVLPLCEQFTSTTFPPTGWVPTFTGTLEWERSTASSFGLGTGSMFYDMWDAANGVNQSMATTEFPATTSGQLNLSLAYAQYSLGLGRPDSIIVEASQNGGGSYTAIARWGWSFMETAPPSGSEFTPTATQWKKVSLALPNGTNKLRFLGKSGFGNNAYLDSICVANFVGINPVTGNVPEIYSLSQNYPNPFNPTTNIKFGLPKAGVVKLVVFDVLGREVATLVNEYKAAGQYVADFDASMLSSGIYFYKIEAGDFVQTKKMLLVK